MTSYRSNKSPGIVDGGKWTRADRKGTGKYLFILDKNKTKQNKRNCTDEPDS